MIVIIDGYNVLKRNHRKPVDAQGREMFIHMLSRYGARKKHDIIVVFDGGPYEWPSSASEHEVEVIYSGRRTTADKVIMRYLKEHRRKDILLVSSDRELNLCASRNEVASIDSGDFYRLVQEALSADQERGQGPIVIDENETDLATLMEQSARFAAPKSDDVKTSDEDDDGIKRTVSKQERLLLAKLKKL